MSLLDDLSKYRVFDIEWRDNHFSIVEGCDNNFSMTLTPLQLKELGSELIAMANDRIKPHV